MDKFIDLLCRHRKPITAVLLALLTAVAAINVFTGLGSSRIRNWDEARHGVSACEMMESGNYIVNTYNFEPDYYNAKPVLSFYNNLLGMKLFGKNIFGFRVVSAFSYLLIAALIFVLLHHTAGTAAALTGMAAFIVCPANWLHSFRNGDPDAVFMLFCFASFVCLWFSVRSKRLLYPAAFFLGLAFLMKSFHVGIPGILTLFFIVYHWKKYSWRDLLIAAAAGMAPVLIWAVLRFHADGWTFFYNMLERDLLGRLEGGHLTDHSYSPWYTYLAVLNHYLIVIPLAVIAVSVVFGIGFRGKTCFSSPSGALGKWAGFCFLFSLAVFSLCRVKLPWYIFPSLLYLPVVFGVIFGFACRWLDESVKKRNLLFAVPPFVIIAACTVWIFIGEGKAIRNLVKTERQRDVLTVDNGGGNYRGCTFYCIDPDGNPCPPHQKFLLVLRFLDARTVMKSVAEYRKKPEHAFLICTFKETRDDAALRRLAEAVSSRHSLRLIRCANSQALYSR